MIVVDASAVGTFLIPDEAGAFAEFARIKCERETLYVPAHWHVEMASLVRKANRRGRILDVQAATAGRVVDAIAATAFVMPPPPVERIIASSADLGLTAYDTVYFLLAKAMRAPLLTDDGALRRVAAAQGVKVLMP